MGMNNGHFFPSSYVTEAILRVLERHCIMHVIKNVT